MRQPPRFVGIEGAVLPWPGLCGLRRKNATPVCTAVTPRSALRLRCARRARADWPARHHDEIHADPCRLLTAALGMPGRRGERCQDLQLFLDRRLDAGRDPERARRARTQGQDDRPPASRRDADGVHQPHRLRREQPNGCSIAKANVTVKAKVILPRWRRPRRRRAGCAAGLGHAVVPTSSGTRKATSRSPRTMRASWSRRCRRSAGRRIARRRRPRPRQVTRQVLARHDRAQVEFDRVEGINFERRCAAPALPPGAHRGQYGREG